MRFLAPLSAILYAKEGMMLYKKFYSPLFFLYIFAMLSLILTSSIHADQLQNLSVSAVVPPTSSAFQFSFTTDAQGAVRQDTTIPYTITYGASSSAGVSTMTTLTADWTGDTAPDGTQVTDYVPGSATEAYDNTQPVIDLLNRTITWTITSLPPGVMDQKVNFSLKTNSNYTKPLSTNITTIARMSNQYATLPEQSITISYLFHPGPPPNAPTSQPVPQPPAAPATPFLQITDISLTQILDTSATVHIVTSTNAKITLLSGMSPGALTQQIRTPTFAQTNDLALSSLSPDTPYYFKVIATDALGQQQESEIYTFRTARTKNSSSLTNSLFSIISNNSVIFSNLLTGGTNPLPVIILPPDTSFQLMVSLPITGWIKTAEINVLDEQSGSATTLPFIGLTPSVFSANLQTGTQTGNYELLGKTIDTVGNLKIEKIAELRVVPPFQITANGSPVADARVTLFVLDQNTGEYKPISEVFPAIQTPLFTDLSGTLSLILPQGTYKAEINAFGFDDRTVIFSIGGKNNTGYPQVTLSRSPFNLASLLHYLFNAAIDFITALHNSLVSLSKTLRYFNAVAGAVVISSIALSFALLHLRTHIKFTHLPVFILFFVHRFTRINTNTFVFGTVTTQDKVPLSQVRIEIQNSANGTILKHTLTNKTGKFYLSFRITEPVVIIAHKDGFAQAELQLDEPPGVPENGLKIILTASTPHKHTLGSALVKSIQDVGGMLFEVSLILTFLFELLFLSVFGIAKTLPFISLSLINLVVWILFLRERQK